MNSLECTICMESFDEKKQRPRCLPCGHTFCNVCIDHSIAIGDKACPTCRKPHKASKASALPVNYLVEDILKENQSAITRNKSDSLKKPQPKKVEKVAKVNSVINNETHYSTFCDCCYGPVSRFRYKCLICVDYDLCQNCEKNIHHTQHPMLRIPTPLTKFDDYNKMDIKCECSSYDPTFVHEDIFCDCCDGSVVGYRYKCLNCENFDICHTCEHERKHSHHLIVRLPTTTESQIICKRKPGTRLSVQLNDECKLQ